MDQSRTPYFDAILKYIEDDVTPLHVPGHKLGNAINQKWKDYVGEAIFEMDICDFQGLDIMYDDAGSVKEAQDLAADAWGAEKSFFLVNGTSCGIISSICALAGEGEKIIIPRNAHKSVAYALVLNGAIPVYVPAEICKEKGLIGGIDPARLKAVYNANPDARAVLAVSPSYHGVCSDIKSLSEVTHAYGGVFMADEAHGNHMYFNDKLPDGALKLGADLVCQSIHKMSGSLGQSSLLHVKNPDVIDMKRLKTNLQMFQTTSPSTLLQISLDLSRHFLVTEGSAVLDRVIELSEYARREIENIDGFEILGKELVGTHAVYDYDIVRLVVSGRSLGLDGYELFEMLRYDYNIEIEFGDYFYALAIMGVGTTKEHVDRFIAALRDIAEKFKGIRKPLEWDEELPPNPPMILTPRQAYFGKTRKIPWADAKGEVSAEMITPYPPGIPTLCPGEKITDEVWQFLSEQSRAGRHLNGVENGVLDYITVVE